MGKGNFGVVSDRRKSTCETIQALEGVGELRREVGQVRHSIFSPPVRPCARASGSCPCQKRNDLQRFFHPLRRCPRLGVPTSESSSFPFEIILDFHTGSLFSSSSPILLRFQLRGPVHNPNGNPRIRSGGLRQALPSPLDLPLFHKSSSPIIQSIAVIGGSTRW